MPNNAWIANGEITYWQDEGWTFYVPAGRVILLIN